MNILFTSVGRRSYLLQYFRQAMERGDKIYAANSQSLSPAFLYADDCVVTPLIYEKGYIPFLLNYCREKNIDAILSLFDVDLPVLARNRKRFEDIGVKLLVSDAAFIDVCNDKWHTYSFLQKHGFSVPRTYLSSEDVLRDVEAHRMTYPIMVKPRWGMGSIGIYEADDPEELRIFSRKVEKEIATSYLKYESQADQDHAVVFQEKIVGQEYGLDIINDLHGAYQATICKKKYAMRSGETDCAVTVEEPLLEELGSRLGRVSVHIANLDCDVILSGEEPYILEMNARFGGGYPFSHMAGVNLPKAILGWLKGERDCSGYLTYRPGVIAQKDIVMVQLRGVGE